ncbi:hypothetical protein Ppa06_70060 [Planomonospora parontospora subsp. parontospora]|uniref:Uncharacterized protein n=2 Tax=Planomonospora parontospora TaxID=58119 RepID=A0AA37F7M2_9ACTN|nr:DUF6245 family protein [Planomonospora parontospora]GGK94007.1 hypothetical protein GCM10010126_61720 [Planomonospora parontospora]GII13208.1 hypothetical protein Ppa06_70060 [Planomonospora parontospora subsp. parontospora]
MDLPLTPDEFTDEPASAEQLGAALAALGLYGGSNTAAEHEAEANRLGGMVPYRMRLANALLGAVQVEAMLVEIGAADLEELAAAHRQQLATAGVDGDPERLAAFLRWQTLRVAGPLRQFAQDPSTGPIPLAAAHTAEGLQRLLGVIGAGQVPSAEAVTEHIAELEKARACLVDAIGNVDILLQMLNGLSAMFGED